MFTRINVLSIWTLYSITEHEVNINLRYNTFSWSPLHSILNKGGLLCLLTSLSCAVCGGGVPVLVNKLFKTR